MTSDRQLLAVTIDDGGGDGDGDVDGNESPNLVGKEAFVGGGSRRDDRCVSRSAVVGRETRRWQLLSKR